jgi:NADPH-dependent curcumin reductase CurA
VSNESSVRNGAVWQAMLALLNQLARVPVSRVASRRAAPTTASTMHEIVSKRLTVPGCINYDFAGEYYPAFLR